MTGFARRTVEFGRWIWTQLTSMRTALALLFLLALAAIPGSLVPQESISPIEVQQYRTANPGLDKVLQPLGMYHVYSTPWFSAVYLLLFISLIGCILPRVTLYVRNLRKPPPKLPARPERLPESAVVTLDGDADAALDAAEAWLKEHRYRVRREPTGLSAERGRSREAGNLVFHIGLVTMLVGFAWTSLYGFRGTTVVVEGSAFSNVITQFDDFTAGGLVNTDDLEPFTLRLDQFDVAFETGAVQRGAARKFEAHTTLTQGGTSTEKLMEVNSPLFLPGGTMVNLLGHGYAAHITVKDGNGDVAFSGPVVFLPQDGNFSSIGVIKVPDARPQRVAFEAIFLPTAVLDETGPHSAFPDALAPELYTNVWSGDPAKETGVPESVYVLNTTGLAPVKGDNGEVLRLRLQSGAGITLPDDLGSITFDGWSRWAKLQVSSRPGEWLTLGSIMAAVLGLCVSLFVRPRRLFVRVTDDEAAVGGLDRTDAASGLDEEVAGLAASLGGTVHDSAADEAEWAAGDDEEVEE